MRQVRRQCEGEHRRRSKVQLKGAVSVIMIKFTRTELGPGSA